MGAGNALFFLVNMLFDLYLGALLLRVGPRVRPRGGSHLAAIPLLVVLRAARERALVAGG